MVSLLRRCGLKKSDPIVRITVKYENADKVCKFIKQIGFLVARAFDKFADVKHELREAMKQGWMVQCTYPL